jgi:hypothetical protein
METSPKPFPPGAIHRRTLPPRRHFCDFAGDVPDAGAKLLYATQYPFQKSLLAGTVTDAAWRSKPALYAVAAEDRTINPELQRYLAKRMEAKTIELPASYLSIILHPREVSELILQAAGQG